MTKYIECDGCGRREDTYKYGRATVSNVKIQGVALEVGSGSTLWTADLCPNCIKKIVDPVTWPRGEGKGS